MKRYCNLELEVIYFETEDVITTSGATQDPTAADREYWPGIDAEV